MGVQTQTRFDTTLNGAITDVQTTAILDDAPAQTTGYGTLERGDASEEDVYWAGLTGLQLTGMLRGLSQTALTNTEVAGNKKAHVDGVSFEGTLLHYIINNKADVDDNEAITGAWTFNTQLPTSTDTPGANAELTTKVYVDTADNLKANLAGGNTFTGVQIFDDDGAENLTDAAPTSDKKLTNKKYVDDEIAGALNSVVSMTAGETVTGATAPQPVCVGSTSYRAARRVTENNWVAGSGATTQNVGNADATSQVAQQFTITDALADSITITQITIAVADQGSPVDNHYLEIQETAGGLPNGTVVADGTSATKTSVTSGNRDTFTYTFSTPPTIVSGTTYAFVFRRSGVNDGTNYYQLGRSNAASVVEGGSTTYTASTTTWAAITTTSDIFYEMILTKSYGGKVFLTDANNPPVSRCDGFVTTSAAADAAVTVQPVGIITGLSGLTAGQSVYASTTAGSLTQSPTAAHGTASAFPEIVVPVGKAFGTTSLAVKHGPMMAGGTLTSILLDTSGSSKETSIFIETGFRPNRIRLVAAGQAAAATNQDFVGQIVALEGVESYDAIVADLADGSANNIITAQSEIHLNNAIQGSGDTDYIKVGTIYDSGFEVTIRTQNTSSLIDRLYWEALGT